MNADIFYQIKSNNNATQLIFMSPSEIHKDPNHFLLMQQSFNGEIGNIAYLQSNNRPIVYIGLGEKNSDTQAIANAVLKIPTGVYITQKLLSESALLMWSVAQYAFDLYKPAKSLPRKLCVSHDLVNNSLITANAIFLIRDLINTPTNDLCPKALSDVIAKLAENYNATWRESVGDALINENFPAIHAVGRGSSSQPRLLSLNWGNEKHPKVTLVGKGVCFDSGGLDLKPASMMRLMKKDMGGAAIAIGLSQWIMAMNLPIKLELLIPAVENSVDGLSYRPGDVLIMRNGLSVEIDNTDAEGRLILADALTHACENKPDLLIDFATLTGAARVAVGTEISAVFSTDDQVVNEIIECGNQVQDPIWRLPLYSGYARLLESNIADLVNSSPQPYAGAITAALFLQRFVDVGVPWVHFDVMAWNISSKPGKPEGGEAMGMLAVANYLMKKYA